MYASKTSPQKYARKVLSQLFSKEELSHCIFKKVGPTTRQELSPNRCSVLESKDAYFERWMLLSKLLPISCMVKLTFAI